MKPLKLALAEGLAIATVIAPTPVISQVNNQSDITGPDPIESSPPTNNQSDITGPDLEENLIDDEPEEIDGELEEETDGEIDDEEQQEIGAEESDIDRDSYESQLEQADITFAVQMLEEYQAVEFRNYLGIELFGDVPSIEEISETLHLLSQATGKKAALIYISALEDRLELMMVLPQPPDTVNGNAQPIAVANKERSTQQPERSLRRVVPIDRETALQAVTDFRNEIVNPTKRRSKTYLPLARQLYQWTIEPLVAKLEENQIDILVFAMDSGLRSLPIAALHDGQNFLIERYAIGLIPSFGLTDINYLDIRASPLLAVGASEFRQLPELPAVPIELQTILSQPWQGEAFINEKFTLQNFILINETHKFGIIHIATHAEFLPGDLSQSYIQFYDRQLSMDRFMQLARDLDWSSVDSSPIELLVLSACRTAVGDPQAELGFAGLAVLAGVKSALASLWYVSDAGTLGLMSEFYNELSQTPLKAEALRRSQLAMIQGEVRVENGMLRLSNGETVPLPPELTENGDLDLSHPYFWSAFMLVGNWN